MPVLPDIVVPTGGTPASDLLKRLRDLLGEEVADFYDDALELLPLLNEGLVQIFSNVDAFPRYATTATVANTDHVHAPTDVTRWRSVKVGGTEMTYMNPVEYAQADAASGTPTSYTPHIDVNGDAVLLLYPTPTSILAVEMFYYGLPNLLSTTGGAEVGATWHRRYHFLPCYYAAAQIFHKDNLPERAELMQSKFDIGVMDYRKWLGRSLPPHETIMSTVAKVGM